MSKKIDSVFPSERMKFMTIILVTLINPWIWRILQNNPFLAVLLIVSSLLLFDDNLFVITGRLRVFFIIVIFLIISIVSLNLAFDRNITILTTEDIMEQDLRHLYYSGNLGGLYLNTVSLYVYNNLVVPISKIERNFFHNLDPNLYFFANHPRERVGIEEFEKYPFFLLPFFIIGFLFVIKGKSEIILAYSLSAALVSSFIRSDYFMGPVLFFPLINVLISFGLIYCIQRVGKFKSI